MMLNKKYTHTLKLCFFNNFKRLNKWFHLKKKKRFIWQLFYMSAFIGLMIKKDWLHLKQKEKASCKFFSKLILLGCAFIMIITSLDRWPVHYIKCTTRKAKIGLVQQTNEQLFCIDNIFSLRTVHKLFVGHLNKAISKSRSIENTLKWPCHVFSSPLPHISHSLCVLLWGVRLL